MAFDFNVYVNSLTSPSSTYRAAFTNENDSSGNSLLLESVINNVNSGSQDVAVVVNPAFTLEKPMDAVVVLSYLLQAYSTVGTQTSSLVQYINTNIPITMLSGGNNTVLPTNNDIAAAWNDFSNTDYVTVNILMGGGYTEPSVVAAINSVVSSRADCEAYIDIDSAYQTTAEAAIDYRQNVLNVNTSRIAAFMPDQLVTNLYNGPSTIYEPDQAYHIGILNQECQ